MVFCLASDRQSLIRGEPKMSTATSKSEHLWDGLHLICARLRKLAQMDIQITAQEKTE